MRDVFAFASIALVIIVVPGPDMALVLRNGLASGRRAALETAVGINAGLLVWGLAAALGIAALLDASASGFTVLKLAGAAYLAMLGLLALRDAWRGGSTPLSAAAGPPGSRSVHPVNSAFRQGLLSNLLNPKSAVVFTTLVPQFVGPDDPAVARTLLLSILFIGMALVWFTIYALLIAQFGAMLRRPVVRRALNAVVGTVLLAFGLRLAGDPR